MGYMDSIESVTLTQETARTKRIPKTLHFIWVGDETKRPDNCIQTWRDHHPDWTIKVWGNETLQTHEWVNAEHMMRMGRRELNGVADMMRWEILYAEGGIVLDADSVCVRKLDDELLACEAFACWESEVARPGLIAAGYFGSVAGNSFVGQLIHDIHNTQDVTSDMAWKTVGPGFLTESYRQYQYQDLKIYPSYYFIPEHFSGSCYQGDGPIYARQLWGSTRRDYDRIKDLDLSELSSPGFQSKGSRVAPPSGKSAQASLASSVGQHSHSDLKSKHDPYFVQEVNVSDEFRNVPRVELLKSMCKGLRVLHIGCADWPITNLQNSLHLALESVCAQLDGMDIHGEALEALRPHVKGRLTQRLADLPGPYDLVLVPEVLEHVPNISDFLQELNGIDARMFVLTVPDAFSCFHRHFQYSCSDSNFTEVVHPDHNNWFTPYTFKNCITKYTPWNIQGIWFFNGISLMMIATKP